MPTLTSDNSGNAFLSLVRSTPCNVLTICFSFLSVKTFFISVIYIILQNIAIVNRKNKSLRFAQTETLSFQPFNFSPLITRAKSVESVLICCLYGLKRLREPQNGKYVLCISPKWGCALRRNVPFQGETDRSVTYSERSVENFVFKLTYRIPQAGILPR